MTTSLISVLFLTCGYSLASPIGEISQQSAIHSNDDRELNEYTKIEQSSQVDDNPSKMDELFKAMMGLQDFFEGYTDDNSDEAETEERLLSNISVLDGYDEDSEVSKKGIDSGINNKKGIKEHFEYPYPDTERLQAPLIKVDAAKINQETNDSTHNTPKDEESQQLAAMFETISEDVVVADNKKSDKSEEEFDNLALNKSPASMAIVEQGEIGGEAKNHSMASMTRNDAMDVVVEDNDQNQSRAGFNPFVKSVNATDDLIVISPSFIHMTDDERADNDTASDDDEFGVLMTVINDDDHEDSKQEAMLPFFPLFGAPILNSVVESLQRLQNQVQSMWNVYGNFNTSVLETLPNNYKNTTSMTKLVDGSLIQVNETVNKEVINGVPHLFHVKVVAVKPQNETHDITVTPSTIHSMSSEHTTTHARDNDTITAFREMHWQRDISCGKPPKPNFVLLLSCKIAQVARF